MRTERDANEALWRAQRPEDTQDDFLSIQPGKGHCPRYSWRDLAADAAFVIATLAAMAGFAAIVTYFAP